MEKKGRFKVTVTKAPSVNHLGGVLLDGAGILTTNNFFMVLNTGRNS